MKIYSPEKFKKERKYILELIFLDFLGLDFELLFSPNFKNTKIELKNGHQFVIFDYFFSKIQEESYLTEKYLPGKLTYMKTDFGLTEDLIIIYGFPEFNFSSDGNNAFCKADLFASAFFMLSRWEEYVIKKRDKFNRFRVKDSYSFQWNFLHRPIVNEYIEFIWIVLKKLGILQKRKIKKRKVYITHDIDRIFLFEKKSDYLTRPLKSLYTDLSLKVFFHTCLLAWQAFIGKDPYHSFDRLMKATETVGLKSYFFFMAAVKSKLDNGYDIRAPYIKQIFEEIKRRGHHIGIHPSSVTWNNRNNLKKEKERLARNIGIEITSGRQHYLIFEAPTTWQVWEDNSIKIDSTLAYSEQTGFRCGICRGFNPFNFLTKKKLKLLEIPLSIMDVTLLNEENNKLAVIKKTKDMIDLIFKYNGDFVFLWHNSSFAYAHWKHYEEVYEEIVNYAASESEIK